MRRDALRGRLSNMAAVLAAVLSILPLCGTVGALTAPEQALNVLAGPAVCLMAGLVMCFLPGKWRPAAAGVALLMTAGAVYLTFPEGSWTYALSALPCAAVLVLLPVRLPRPAGQEWGTPLWASGMVTGLAAQVIFYAVQKLNVPAAVTLRHVLAVGFALLVLLALESANRSSMEQGVSRRGAAPSPDMRRLNRGAVLLMFLVALVVSCWKSIEETLTRWLDGVRSLLVRVMAWLMRLTQGTLTEPGGGGGDGGASVLEGLEDAPTSALAVFLEKVFMVLGWALLAAGAAFALYRLSRVLRKGWRWFAERWQSYLRRGAEDYQDETESLFDAQEVGRALTEKLRGLRPVRKKPRPVWGKMDERAKTRYLYRLFQENHKSWQNLTAREALEKENLIPRNTAHAFADLYDRARYSDHPMTPGAADAMKEKLKY